MTIFILAGFQQSIAADVKKALTAGQSAGRLNGWDYRTFPSEKRDLTTIGQKQIDTLCKLAASNGGAHIFGVSKERDRERIEDQIRPYFRFRWVEPAVVLQTGGGNHAPLLDALEVATAEENYWVANIKPISVSTPLILPDIFNAIRDLEEVWRLSESYNNLGHLEAAANLIARFPKEHRRKIDEVKGTPWLASNSLIWDDGGPRHGTPPFPKNWKYSFEIDQGFHFDVSAHSGKKASFKDSLGKSHAMPKGYLNVTAHGEVRGA